MRAKLRAKPLYSYHHHWTKMDKICIAPALQLNEATFQQGRKNAVRGSNPLTPTRTKARSTLVEFLPALLYATEQACPISLCKWLAIKSQLLQTSGSIFGKGNKILLLF